MLTFVKTVQFTRLDEVLTSYVPGAPVALRMTPVKEADVRYKGAMGTVREGDFIELDGPLRQCEHG